jgi:uncharacterized protein DUF2760
MQTWHIVVLSIAGFVAVRFLLALLLCGGDFGRLLFVVRAAYRLERDREFADKVKAILQPPPPPPAPKPSGAPLRMLVLLQREGRLVDFLLENIDSYGNDQVGAAVRDIHRQCQKALKQHLVLAPIFKEAEGDSVQVPVGFDPALVQLTGNVTGEPPFHGSLRHHGWRVQEFLLNPPREGQDEFILQPAEVELP